MPYIKDNLRDEMDPSINDLSNFIENEGDLNYAITQLCRAFLTNSKGNYQAYNSIIGVLECAKLEFYRRAVSKYEDKKIKENSDVY